MKLSYKGERQRVIVLTLRESTSTHSIKIEMVNEKLNILFYSMDGVGRKFSN